MTNVEGVGASEGLDVGVIETVILLEEHPETLAYPDVARGVGDNV